MGYARQLMYDCSINARRQCDTRGQRYVITNPPRNVGNIPTLFEDNCWTRIFWNTPLSEFALLHWLTRSSEGYRTGLQDGGAVNSMVSAQVGNPEISLRAS